jgi:hypothetical protein
VAAHGSGRQTSSFEIGLVHEREAAPVTDPRCAAHQTVASSAARRRRAAPTADDRDITAVRA